MNKIKYNILLCKLWEFYSAVYPVSCFLLSSVDFF